MNTTTLAVILNVTQVIQLVLVAALWGIELLGRRR